MLIESVAVEEQHLGKGCPLRVRNQRRAIMLRAMALRTAFAPRRAAARALSLSHGAPAAASPAICPVHNSVQWPARACDTPPHAAVKPGVGGTGMLASTVRRGLCSASSGGGGGGGQAKGADWKAGGDADGTQEEVPGATWEGLTEEEAAAAVGVGSL